MWLVRFYVFLFLFSCVFYVSDSYSLRHQTSEKEVVAAKISSASIDPLDVVSTEVLNDDSRMKFAVDALVMIFNYKPGDAEAHISTPKIKALFSNMGAYERFKESFIIWSYREINVNKISIKESLNVDAKMTQAIPINITDSIWLLKGEQLFLNRGLGDTLPERLMVDMILSYEGRSKGLGIYHLALKR
jgi:hypothetical protein